MAAGRPSGPGQTYRTLSRAAQGSPRASPLSARRRGRQVSQEVTHTQGSRAGEPSCARAETQGHQGRRSGKEGGERACRREARGPAGGRGLGRGGRARGAHTGRRAAEPRRRKGEQQAGLSAASLSCLAAALERYDSSHQGQSGWGHVADEAERRAGETERRGTRTRVKVKWTVVARRSGAQPSRTVAPCVSHGRIGGEDASTEAKESDAREREREEREKKKGKREERRGDKRGKQ